LNLFGFFPSAFSFELRRSRQSAFEPALDTLFGFFYSAEAISFKKTVVDFNPALLSAWQCRPALSVLNWS
jgi:hypothetical protein